MTSPTCELSERKPLPVVDMDDPDAAWTCMGMDDQRLEALEVRLESVESKLESVESKLDGLGTRLDDFVSHTTQLQASVERLTTTVRDLSTSVDRLRAHTATQEDLQRVHRDIRGVISKRW
jgi:archaellum component FlaC